MDNIEVFLKEFDKSCDWQKEFSNLKIIGNEQEILNFLKSTNVKELYIEDYLIQYLIFVYTLSGTESKSEYNKYKKIILNNYKDCVNEIKIVHNDKFNLEELIIKTNEGDIEVLKLSSLIPKLREIFIEEENIDIETIDRMQKCFFGSYKISSNLGIENDLVTGYIYGESDKEKYIHSFVETKLHEKEYVIDFTQNAIIDKESYYRIKHIKKNDIVEKISSENVINDPIKYGKISDYIDLRIDVYNIFRDEFIKDFKRVEDNFSKKGRSII